MKDDVKRLRKTVKKEGKKKAKSAEEWKQRGKDVAKDKRVRAEKRQANINDKIQRKKQHKGHKVRGGAQPTTPRTDT